MATQGGGGGGTTDCVVPRVIGKSLATARALISSAHCSLGTVHKPHKHKHKLVVIGQTPGSGQVLAAGGAVNLRLGSSKK